MQELNNYIDYGSFNSIFGLKEYLRLGAKLPNNDVVLDDDGTKSNKPKKTATSGAVSLVRIITMVHVQINTNVADIYDIENKEILDDGNNDGYLHVNKYNFCFFVCLLHYIYLCCNIENQQLYNNNFIVPCN